MIDSRLNALIHILRDSYARDLNRDILALYLRGSAAREEWIKGLSDVDFYVIVKEGKSTPEPAIVDLQSKLRSVIRGYDPAEISFRVVSESEIGSSQVQSFLTGLDAQLVAGQDVLGEFQKPSINKIRSYGKEYTSYLCDFWMEPKEASRSLEEQVRETQYMLLKLAQSSLVSRGILALKKGEVVEAFLKEYANFRLAYLIYWAWKIRSNWPESMARPQEMERFVKEAKSFPLAFREYLNNRESNRH